MKRRIAPLAAGCVRLRLLEEADLALTRAWRNQDHIRRRFFSSDPIPPEQHAAWFAQYVDRDDDFVFVIEETEVLRRPVGQVSLYRIDWTAGRAEFGRLMIGDPDGRGRGLARLATARLVAEAFGAWGLNEVHLEVQDTNAAAIAVYAACGFEVVDRRDGRIAMRMIRSSGAG